MKAKEVPDELELFSRPLISCVKARWSLDCTEKCSIEVVNLTNGTDIQTIVQPVRTSLRWDFSVAIPQDFDTKGSIYIHLNPKDGERRTELSEWELDDPENSLQKKRLHGTGQSYVIRWRADCTG